MEQSQLTVRFTENAEEEISDLVNELRLIPLAAFITKSEAPVPEELKEHLGAMLNVLFDIFSINLPEISKDTEIALRTISRDINLARLLRERGLFRLYKLVNGRVGIAADGTIVPETSNDAVEYLPAFMTKINPNTGGTFGKQEEFIGWFCEEAHVSRGLVFMRLAAIERMLAIGFSLEEAFRLVVSKPFAVQETLTSVATWDKGTLIRVEPEVAKQLARKIDPDNIEHISDLADAAENDPLARIELNRAIKPLIAGLVEEVAAHDRAKDAMEFVRNDILMQPEISYTWDNDGNSLIVHFIPHNIDPETGEEYESKPITIPFIPDALVLPKEIRDDLIKRLPIRNRYNLDN